MKLVVGLGNPGRKYAKTRHNAGFMVVGRLAEHLGVSLEQNKFDALYGEWPGEGKVVFLLPQTFMNESGRAVQPAADFFKVGFDNLIIVHDDVDLPLGRMKLDYDAGSAGHRGVQDVIDALGRQDFYRLRVGVGRPRSGGDVVDFVLTPFDKEENETVEEVVEKGAVTVEKFIREDIDKARNFLTMKGE